MRLISVLALFSIALIIAGTAPNRPEPPPSPITQIVSELASEVPSSLSKGSTATIHAYLASARNHERRDPHHSRRLLTLANEAVSAAKQGQDIIEQQRGFFWRGYATRFAPFPEMYSIYVPKAYTRSKKWPLIVSLHGGSSNHNVWMAMLLGHQLTPAEYRRNFRTHFAALVHEDKAIIVAPQGMGQNHWLGEAQQDVTDVIDDVRANYAIDDNKIFLNGLSNGAVASYKIGLERAWRFAGVLPMSGFVDWVDHATGGVSDDVETRVLRNESPLTIAENAFNTSFVFYHGVKDSGFDVSQARRFSARLTVLDIPHRYNEIFHLGHHLTHLLWRDMRILSFVDELTRDDRPREVRLTTTSERSNRQFWAVLDDRKDHLRPGRLHARVDPDEIITVRTENVRRFTLLLKEAPLHGGPLIRVDGKGLPLDPAIVPGSEVTLISENKAPGGWRRWDGAPLDPGLRKQARLSGPLGDASWEAQVHVFGTLVAEETPRLERAATLGARGWTPDPEFTQVRHPVISDRTLKNADIKDRVLVLYGNARNNAILRVIGHKLPIRIGTDSITLRDQRLTHPSTGAKFICPNPLNPNRYLVVQAGLSADAVERGGVLPIFLGDFVVFDNRFTHRIRKVVFGRQPLIETGFFTESWRLPEAASSPKND